MLRPLALGLAFGLPLSALATMMPANLRCEYLTNPLGIGETKPRLSWIVASNVRSDVQSAYRVLVASSPEKLKAGEGDLWDSGPVASSETVGIEYAGKPLRSRQAAWWTVTVWDVAGQPKTGKPASWEMGLLDRSDWSASWIGMSRPASPQADVNWIWTDEGGPTKEAPGGDRLFRTFLEGEGGTLGVAADNSFVAVLNGQTILQGTGWGGYTKVDLKPFLKPGLNELVIRANNESKGFAGLAALGEIVKDGARTPFATSAAWEASIDGAVWKPATAWTKMGASPYGTVSWDGPQSPPHLRRTFEVKRPVRRARVYATAKGVYRLMLDGKTVGKGLFNPGWTDYRKRIQVQTYDVTPLLRSGKHTVGMLAGDGWYAGHVGWGEQKQHYGDRPFGLAQLEIEYEDGTTERIASGDAGWQAASGGILSSDFLQGEVYDARLDLGAWSTPGGNRGQWAAPDVQPLAPEDNLVAQRGPAVERYAELKPKAMAEPKPGVYVVDLGQNMVGWARLKAKGKSGQKVTMRFAEILNPDGTLYTANLRAARVTDEIVLKGGAETYEPTFTFHGFRYVEVTGIKPEMDDVTGIVVTSATPQAGTFACSNPLVNQLQSNIEWGQRGNYFDVPTDCPQRDERLGWMGDAQVFARTATGNADVAAFLTKWLDDVTDAQSPEGGFSDVSPRLVDLNDGAPGWGDAGVIVPWTLYEVYGDRRILERKFDAMKGWVDYIEAENPDGLWAKRRNNDFGDWLNVGTEPPRELLATAYFAHSADLVARSARVLGKTPEAERYEALFAKIKRAFNDKWVTADGHIADETQTAYVLALRFNLLPQEKRAMAAEHLVADIESRNNHLSTGFLGVSYLNPVLTQVGRSDVAYKLLQNDTYPSWGYSIRQGATTIWERWDGWTKGKGFQDPGMNSFNHYSLGSVGEWMMASVAGIDMGAPGFAEIVIRPEVGGGMTWAKGSYDSVRGRIESAWKLDGAKLTLDVTIPANTVATIYVPTAEMDSVREGKDYAILTNGVRFLRMENGNAVYLVGGGKYRFTSYAPQPVAK